MLIKIVQYMVKAAEDLLDGQSGEFFESVGRQNNNPNFQCSHIQK